MPTPDGIFRSLARSLRPIFVWFQVIGIDLVTCQNRRTLDRWIRFIIATIFLALNVGFSTWGIVLMYCTDEQKHGKTFSWNLIFHHIIYALRSIGVHLVLVCFTQKVWQDLWTAFQNMELELDLNKCQRNLRCVSIIGLLYIIVKVLAHLHKFSLESIDETFLFQGNLPVGFTGGGLPGVALRIAFEFGGRPVGHDVPHLLAQRPRSVLHLGLDRVDQLQSPSTRN